MSKAARLPFGRTVTAQVAGNFVKLVAPAAGSLTFVTNALAARWLLKENVDRRRWVAAVLVCCGVALLKR